MKREVHAPRLRRNVIRVAIASAAVAHIIAVTITIVRDIQHQRDLEAISARLCPEGSAPYWISDGSRCVFAGVPDRRDATAVETLEVWDGRGHPLIRCKTTDQTRDCAFTTGATP